MREHREKCIALTRCQGSRISSMFILAYLLDTDNLSETSNDSVIYYLKCNIFKNAYATVFRGLTNAAYLKPPAMT